MMFSLGLSLNRKSLYQVVRAAFVAGSLTGLAIQSTSAIAQTSAEKQEMPRIITVTGEGIVTATPDIASVMVGVISQEKTAREAVSLNTNATGNVIEAFQKAGIEQRDLATSGFSVQPRYIYPKNGSEEAPRIDGYEVRNTLTIRVRDITKLGSILDTAITSGSNRIEGISFDVADDTALLDQAKARAVEDAQRKAEILAKAAGVKLGRVMMIDGGTFGRPQPRNMMLQASADAFSAKGAVPVEAGEQEFRSSISITWELAE